MQFLQITSPEENTEKSQRVYALGCGGAQSQA